MKVYLLERDEIVEEEVVAVALKSRDGLYCVSPNPPGIKTFANRDAYMSLAEAENARTSELEERVSSYEKSLTKAKEELASLKARRSR